VLGRGGRRSTGVPLILRRRLVPLVLMFVIHVEAAVRKGRVCEQCTEHQRSAKQEGFHDDSPGPTSRIPEIKARQISFAVLTHEYP
jgi:hypothetical protein